VVQEQLFRFYHELAYTIKVTCFPKVPLGDVVDLVEEAHDSLGAFDCILEMSMTYEQVSPGPRESY
jgi:hypothetical protein